MINQVNAYFLWYNHCSYFTLPVRNWGSYDVYKLLSVIVAFDCTQVPRITLINTLYLYPSVISWAESDTTGDFPFYACLCFSVLSSAAVQLKGATFSFVESEEVTLAFPLTNSVIWNSLINKQVNWSEWSAKQRSGLESFHETRVSVERANRQSTEKSKAFLIKPKSHFRRMRVFGPLVWIFCVK